MPKLSLESPHIRSLPFVRALAASFAADSRASFARSFTAALVKAYWAHECARLNCKFKLRQPWIETSSLDAASATEMREVLQELQALDRIDALHVIGRVYTSALEPAFRSEHGAFYTPRKMALELVAMAEAEGADLLTAKILDPAAGAGSLLIAVIERIVERCQRSPRRAVETVKSNIIGLEKDPFAAWLCQSCLELQLLPQTVKTRERLGTLVEVADSLEQISSWNGHFDLVIGNPPYGRTALDSFQRGVFARSVFGHANLYGLFTDAAVSWTKPGGLIAFLTPTSFLGGEYFKNLRRLLIEQAPPARLAFVSSRSEVFDDVLQETLLSVFARESTHGSVAVTTSNSVSAVEMFEMPCGDGRPWLLARKASSSALVRAAGGLRARLLDYGYRVSTGQLVWNRHKEQFRACRGKGHYPVIWAESVTRAGEFHWKCERRKHAPFFAATERDQWVITRRPAVLVQRTTSKEQQRRVIAAELPDTFVRQHGGVIIENHLNMIVPVVKEPAVSAACLARILNSEAFDILFRSISGSVAVSASEISAVPLPNIEAAKTLEKTLASTDSAGFEAAVIATYFGSECESRASA